jgi:flap endonuclease-1
LVKSKTFFEQVKFMCGEKGFAEDRIRNGAKKLLKARQGSTQGRLDSFFKVMPTTPNGSAANGKRKSEEVKNGGSAKKAKGAAGAKKGFYKR